METKSDKAITHHITELVTEEQDLRSSTDLSTEDRERLNEIQVELDQCYDLLRQRRAKREYGENPDEAHVRSEETVEHYDHVDEDLAAEDEADDER